MTSLFSRLQKLNKEASEGAWVVHGDGDGDEWVVAEDGPTVAHTTSATDARFIAECRNSLPAVLHLIEAAQRAIENKDVLGTYTGDKLREAVAVFVSGQEDRR